jgi:hypothetical protein
MESFGNRIAYNPNVKKGFTVSESQGITGSNGLAAKPQRDRRSDDMGRNHAEFEEEGEANTLQIL